MKTACIALSAALGLALVSGAASAQQPPTENKGMSASQLSGLDLSKQGLNDLNQRQMRIRQINIEAGGVAAFHSHGQRPALSYVMKGNLLEHRKGAPDRTYMPGDVITESTDVDHWVENKGSEAATIISVDLFKE